MKIKNYKNESGATLLKRVEREARKGFNPLKASYLETVELARKYMPEVVEALKEYIVRPYKSTMRADEAGICEEITVARSKVVRAFKVSTGEQIRSMTPWGVYQHESYLYNLVETVFDMSLLVEQGLSSTFQQDYDLQKTLVKMGIKHVYVGYYCGRVIWVDVTTGQVYRYKKIYKEEISLKHSKYGDVTVITESGKRVEVISKYEQVGKWVCMTEKEDGTPKGLKHEKGKVYQKLQLSQRDEDKYGKAYYIAVHHLVGMCVWGYNSVKHCRGFASLLTVDHINGDTLDNRVENLRLMTRVDNTSISSSEDKRGFDWVEFFERVERDREEASGYGKGHYQMWKEFYEERYRDKAI